MKRKIEKCWRDYKKHWTVTTPDNGNNPFREGAVMFARIRFGRHVRNVLKQEVLIEWQDNGDCIVAGIIYFSLT